jgi:hypothetical protein
MQAESATGGDDDAVVEGVDQFGQTVIATCRGRVEVGGTLHVERLVGTFLIELAKGG